MALIRAEHLVKTYRAGEVEVPAVKDADFTIEAKSFVAFVGPSGSGKSTLLNMIGCLDRPTGGKLTVLDTDVGSLNRRSAAHFRGSHVGFVFQDFNLIPVLTVRENIEYPLIMVQDWPEQKRREQVKRLLEAVGMLPRETSGPIRFRAVRSSASPWRGRSRPIRSSCWRTSRRRISIATRRCASSS